MYTSIAWIMCIQQRALNAPFNAFLKAWLRAAHTSAVHDRHACCSSCERPMVWLQAWRLRPENLCHRP